MASPTARVHDTAMTITEIARRVIADRQAWCVRCKTNVPGEPRAYDTYSTGYGPRRRGWVMLTPEQAGAIMTVHRGLRSDLQPKLDTIPLAQLVDFCWRVVA